MRIMERTLLFRRCIRSTNTLLTVVCYAVRYVIDIRRRYRVVDSSESFEKDNYVYNLNMAVRMSMTNDDYDAYCATLLLLRWIRCWVRVDRRGISPTPRPILEGVFELFWYIV
jgi:hypothetical protein